MPEPTGIPPGRGSTPGTSLGEVPFTSTPGIEGRPANNTPPSGIGIGFTDPHHSTYQRPRSVTPTTIPLVNLTALSAAQAHPLARLDTLAEVFSPIRAASPYEILQTTLAELGQPYGESGRRISYLDEIGRKQITIRQNSHESSIEVTIQAQSKDKNTRVKSRGRLAKAPMTLRYLPNQNIRTVGIQGHEVSRPGDLGARARSTHFQTFDSLRRHIDLQRQAVFAFERLNGQLRVLQPSEISNNGTRWYHGIVPNRGNIYSLSLRHGSEAQDPFRTEISRGSYPEIGLHKFSKSGTGEEILRIRGNGERGSRNSMQMPSPSEFRLLNQVNGQLQVLLNELPWYSKLWRRAIPPLGRYFSGHSRYQRKLSRAYTRIFGNRHGLPIPNMDTLPTPKFRTSSYKSPEGEVVYHINNGYKLVRYALRGTPMKIGEVEHKVRPSGAIRKAMLLEAFVYGWNNFNGLLSDPLGIRVQNSHNSVALRLHPNGAQRVEIYRGDQLHQLVTTRVDGQTINLGRQIKIMQQADPTLMSRTRTDLLSRAAGEVTRFNPQFNQVFRTQIVPPITLNGLAEIASKPTSGFHTARGAWNALLKEVPGFSELEARVSHTSQGNQNGKRASIEVIFPNSSPPTQLRIFEQPTALIFESAHGNTLTRATFRNGQLVPGKSTQYNPSIAHQASQGFYKQAFIDRLVRLGTRNYAYWRAGGQTYVFGHIAGLPLVYGLERLFLTEGERRLIGTPMPQFSLGSLWEETKVAGALLTGGGLGTMAVDGVFNYAGGLKQVAQSYRGSTASFASVYGYHRPYLLNRVPLLSRPIPKTLWMGRAFAQRATPLLGGLIALDMMSRGSFTPKFDERTIDMAMRVGAVSIATSSFFALGQRTLERAAARNMVAGGLYGALYKTGGRKFFGKFFIDAGKFSCAGATYFNTFRCMWITNIIELAALKLWDTHDRKDLLLEQENQLRKGLALAMDQYNRLTSRVALGDDISFSRLQEAKEEVKQAHRRYASYLKIMERTSGDGNFSKLSLDNNYEAENFSATPQTLDPKSKIAFIQKDQELSQKRKALYVEQGMAAPDTNKHPESLYEFLKNINSQDLESTAQTTDPESISDTPDTLPFAFTSSQGKKLITYLSNQLSYDSGFWRKDLDHQAKILVRELSAFTVQGENGGTRSWEPKDAKKMLLAILEENERRLDDLETPLLKPRGDVNRMMKQWEKVAQEEAKIFESYAKDNLYFTGLENQLEGNQKDLQNQVDDYLAQANKKLPEALKKFWARRQASEPTLSSGQSQGKTYQAYDDEELGLTGSFSRGRPL